MVPDENLVQVLSDSQKSDESGQAAQNSELLREVPVVAVGASAGGLEAITNLLRHLPADTGMAFVLIQHLAPGHASMLAQLLSRETAMPVNQIKDGTVLSPNQVYVIPPNAAITISDLAIAVRPRESAGTEIDTFLRSLAASRKSAAVAVILSGTGSDGALGVQAIAEEGGVVFAQEPASAKFDGMPRSAIGTSCVDFVLPPEEIAAELTRIAREPLITRPDTADVSGKSLDSLGDVDAVFDLVRAGTGIDFHRYRQSTVRRRLLRRLALLRLNRLRDYVEYLKENPEEAQALTQDVLIRVTRFFRDPEAFDVLSRRVFPALIRRTPLDRFIRIWVPGCSTGEEAYSIIMCFLEVAEQMRSRVSLQVFATDLNEAAIEKARRGVYLENIAADISPERLARFFVRGGKEYIVNRKLRDLCVFSRHDLLSDPPFSRMDLVSCRNVLIYLDSTQERAFSVFHFALNPGGFLLLGKSESAASFAGLFTPMDKEVRLYVRQESTRNPSPAYTTRKRVARPPQEAVSLERTAPHRPDPRREADRLVLQRYGPARVIVNGDLEAVADSDEGAALLEPASNVENQEVLELIKRDTGELKRAIHKANRTGQPTRMEHVKIGEGAALREVSLELTPLGPERHHFLIVVGDHAGRPEPDLETGETPVVGVVRKFERRIRRLEREVASSRAHLESVIVEQEAANEEAVASNEELESLNEELASSKEELEATNEELTTINQELQVRNTELEIARDFAQATIDTVRGSLLVLGSDLRVLKANRSFYAAFRQSPAEVEHSFIYELGGGRWNIPRLRQLLEETLRTDRTINDFEMEYDVPPLGGRILLLNACRFEREERILLAIEDVTESRRVEEELRQSQKMEAIGYLAAGVAHDFNNLLTGVIGNASMVADALPEHDPHKATIETAIAGAQRAADLTRQLLAYAGKGRFYLERVDLSHVAIETGRLVHPSLPANVQLRLDLDKSLPLLLADASQMQQVVMNLVINGAEAIGERGGTITVRTGCQTVTDEPLPDLHPAGEVAPGEYVFLEVQDNGSGMNEQTIRKIFDPFFTTKFTGRGLGLAAVLGIVRQQKGAIQVRSVPGRGTCFRVLFPAREKVGARVDDDVTRDELRGSGIVLIVDDEEMIRKYTGSALETLGYTVLLAQSGQEAVRLVRESSGDIRLVLLDVAMPGMDGLQTLERLREIRPELRVVVCSGFGDRDVEARFAGKDVTGFFPKPFTVKQLGRKVKECMPSDGSDD